MATTHQLLLPERHKQNHIIRFKILIFHSNVCEAAQDSQLCPSYVSDLVSYGIVTSYLDGLTVLQKFLVKYMHQTNNAIPVVHKIKNQINDIHQQGALAELIYGVLTNHVTCLDELDSFTRTTENGSVLDELIPRAKAALAILASATTPNEEVFRLLIGKMPSWFCKDIKANAVVAQDGSGDYQKLGQAVAAAPDRISKNVEVTKRKMNLMIVGDGMNSTIITDSLNVVDGSTTFRSATLAAVGQGFVLHDICVQHTAGSGRHQAMALRVGADMSVINRCRIDAYLDTLYAHSLRQYAKLARKPDKTQNNMVTAQGRTDPNQATWTSIQFCDIIASPDLEPVKNEFRTYLGALIDPAGWAEWSGDFALKILYYGEYMNNGPRAGTSKRVKWPGYHVITDPAEALPFTVAELIQGGSWLSSTGVAYVEALDE
ncbi:unnamed protein product [Withania somnifera]